MAEEQEPALVRSARDASAFSEFYAVNAKPMALFFTRRILDAEAALDLTAETFAQAYAGRTRFRGHTHEAAQAWLYTIAHRQLAGYLRRGYAERKIRDRLGIELPPPADDELARIHDQAGTAALRDAVRAALAGLPAEQRTAVQLRIIDELPYPDVAAALEISEQAARARVSRGLRALRPALAPIAERLDRT